MKNLYLLPTDKPSRLFKRTGDLFLEETFSIDPEGNYHLYITSEEKIKQGDWCIYPNGQVIKYLVELNTDWLKRIILTTDHSLEGVQQIDDEFLKWFVKNPTCEFIQVVTDLNTEGKNGLDRAKFIYKIIIPKQEPFIEFTNTNDCTSMIYNPKEEIQSYICPKTNKQCDDECCVSAENCNIGEGVFSEQDSFYEQLVKYFETTPREKVLEDWAKSTEFDNIGLTVEEFLGNKQETIEDVAEEYSRKMWGVYYDGKHPDCAIEKTQGEISVSDFIAGAKWQREIASRLIDRYVDDVMGGCNLKFKEWINR